MSTNNRNESIQPYLSHTYDKHYWISRSKTIWKDKSVTRTANFEFKPTLILGELGMSKARLKLFKLKKFNHSHVRGKYSKVELEQKILNHLDEVRNHIGRMLDMKGNVGYSDLRLGHRIIAARLCYEKKSVAKGEYYYGDDIGDSEDNYHPFFIMKPEDHWIERYIADRDNLTFV
eukprot:506111_1